MSMKARCFIGTSGWFYGHWSGSFYPEGLTKDKLLGFYGKYFDTVELNNTFYHLPKKSTVKAWEKKTAKKFLFSVKASRFITHIKRLKVDKKSIKLFFDRIKGLKKKTGPVLFQLPPSMKKDVKRLDKFLSALPKRYKYVMEFRHKSWLADDVYDVLRKYKTAFCIISMPKFPHVIEATAPFSYIRMHGARSLYSSNYSKKELAKWAGHIKKFLKKGLDVYIYFNNDANAYAVKNALALKKLIGE